MITYIIFKGIISLNIEEVTLNEKDNMTKKFKEIYIATFNEKISNKDLEKEKLNIESSVFKFLLIFFIVSFIITKIMLKLGIEEDEVLENASYTFFIAFFVYVLYISKKNKKYYSEKDKKLIFSKFISLINPNLIYKGKEIDFSNIKNEYINSKFDYREGMQIECEDYICGKLEDDIFINICDLYSFYYTIENNGEKEEKHYSFSGLFAHIEIDKMIDTSISVVPNKLGVFKDKSKVKIDSILFEKYFDVYAENHVEAMKLMNSSMVEAIINAYSKYKIDFEIKFTNNKIYFRFFTEKMFELYSENKKERIFYYYYCVISLITELVNEIIKIMRKNEIGK